MSETTPAVRVHIASSDVAAAAPTRQRRRRHTVLETRNILSTETSIELLPYAETRLYALLQAGGNDCVITLDKGSAQNGKNQTAGLPDPIGMVLTVGNTTMTKIEGGMRLWATAAAYPAQITMAVCYEEEV